jgi:hypothetical protein
MYDTPAGAVHAKFASSVVVLARVPEDGWIPLLGRGRTTGRSLRAVTEALVSLGLPPDDAQQLADVIVDDWQEVEIPQERSRSEQLRDVVRIGAMVVRLLVALPRWSWQILRGRGDSDEPPEGFVPPASSEYAVIRVVETSRGWAQFEFWGDQRGNVGVFREDGWLPMSTVDHHLDEHEAVDALQARGLPADEAERTAALVFAERRARTTG